MFRQVTIDNCTASNYSVVNVVCRDRKGLIYDLMRTLKDIHCRVAYAKICVRGEAAEVDLFVEEADGQRSKERRAPCAISISPTPYICTPGFFWGS
jgi:UTP:GlnB (protein PII) uridylyltransferase